MPMCQFCKMCSTVVEHSSRHPKFKGLSPATATSTKDRSNGKKIFVSHTSGTYVKFNTKISITFLC